MLCATGHARMVTLGAEAAAPLLRRYKDIQPARGSKLALLSWPYSDLPGCAAPYQYHWRMARRAQHL